MDLNKRADISKRYLLQKGETVSAKTVEDLMLELNAAKEKISNLKLMGEWQPIETAPKDKTIIVFMGNYVVTAKWYDDKFAKKPRPYFHCESLHFMGKNWQRENQPAYWMPLPEAPVISND